MADYPRQGNSDRTLRSHGEQIRRIRTRIPQDGMPIVTFTAITDADLYNRSGPFEGWQINDPIVFSKQGNTIHVWGSVQWTGASGGYPFSRSLILRTGVLPAEFTPNTSRRILTTSGGVDTPEQLWELFLLSSGIIQTASFQTSATTAPWGTLVDFELPVVNLEFTYPAVI